MKKNLLIIALIIFISYLYKAFSQKIELFQDFEKQRVLSAFTLISYNGTAILVGSSDGTVLFSTNGGIDWERSNISGNAEDFISIVSIDRLNNHFVALSKEGKIWESLDDFGKDWILRTTLQNGNYFKIQTKSEKLFVLKENQILLLNPDFSIVGQIDFVSDTAMYDMVVHQNTIFYSAGKGKIGKYNTQTQENKIIDLSSKNICSICGVPYLFGSYNDYTVSFKMKLDDREWLIFLNTLKDSVEKIDFIISPKYPLINWKTKFLNFYNNLIYHSDTLYVYLIDPESKQTSTFKSGRDRYIAGTSFSNAMWLGGDTIIAVGKNNLIFISYDGAKNWHIVSYFNPNPRSLSIFDRYNIRCVYNPVNFAFTTDQGKTWLSLSNWLEDFDTYQGYYTFEGFFKDKNNGIYYGGGTRPVITMDGGNTCSNNFRQKNLYGELLGVDPGFFAYKGLYFIRTISLYKDTVYSILHFLNDTVGMVKRSYYANKYFLLFPPDNPNSDTLFALIIPKDQSSYTFSFSTDTGMTWSDYFNFTSNDNYSLNAFRLKKIGNNFFIFTFTRTSDSTGFHTLFKFNWNEKKMDKIFEYPFPEINNFNNFVTINDTTFVITYAYFNPKPSIGLLINKNFYLKPYNWEKYTFEGKRFQIGYIISSIGDSVYYVSVYDTLYKAITGFVFWKEQVNGITERPMVEQGLGFVVTQPIPQPSKGLTKFKVYFDYQNDYNNFVFNCYDILGRAVLTQDEFKINLLNSYTIEVTVGTQNLPAGVYYIVARLGKTTKAIPLFVE
ncbi:MAG: hypothetical protein ACP5RR_02375 [Candidatus Kapaibacteriota bacterium]